ncbi:uncharacterized protein KD926_002812 [Aspergillus affinis]|uniref:uncharacterized protein n=1 Tax=Aspergillus affinis TaxID=1070780 RepID=UPI0022FE4822|nr:uncharacterized protein KD926_002812 [Aspergillus affinis]KAI9035880.1 hypothetical protein KD926_002812 [Aspergillus affinis]
MPDFLSTKMMRRRLHMLPFFILNLTLAILNSAIARYAILLRDRARWEITEPENVNLAVSFQQLMGSVHGTALLGEISSVFSTIVGLILVVYPSFPRERYNFRELYVVFVQCISLLLIIITGIIVAACVSGFKYTFTRLQGDDRISYYSIMYYGGIGEAVLAALVIIIP